MKHVLIRLFVCFGIFLGALSAHAQNARFFGQITDPQGAVVVKASVQVINMDTKAKLETLSDEVGHYAVSFLPAGNYHVIAQAAGFGTFDTELSLGMGQALDFDIQLSLASSQSEVNVEGNMTAAVEVESSEVTGTITGKEVPAIGLNGRNFTQLTTLVPGVSNQTGKDEARVGMAGSVSFSINGGRTEYNSFQVDGSETINTGVFKDKTSLIVTPSIDSIQEIKVLTSNYNAVYPSVGNGTTIVTTKSGTDQLHGDAYEFLRNEFMNAKGYFDVGDRAPLYRRNDFGGTLGGPITLPHLYNGKGKTFFFVSEEGRLEKDPYPYRQAVPSVAERNGDFSDVCPVTTPGISYVTFSRSQNPDCPGIETVGQAQAGLYQTFPNNKIPLNSNALIMLGTGVIPAPNATSGCNSTTGSCYNADVSLPTRWREDLFRIDHRLSDTMNASFRFIHDAWDTTTNVPQFAYVQNSFPTIENGFNGPGISLVARLTKVVSSTLLNEFVASYTDQKITLTDAAGSNVTLQGADLLGTAGTGMTTIFNNGSGGKMPGMVIAGNNQEYGGRGFSVDPGYMPWEHTSPVYSFSDNLTKSAGKHNLQVGLQWIIFQRNQTNGSIGAATGDTQGILTFSNTAGGNTTGNSVADFLSGQSIASYQQDSTQGRYRQRYMIAEPYLQDNFKVNSRLMVNMGLRLSLFGSFHELNNNAYNFQPSAYDAAEGATLTVGSQGQLVDKATGTNLTINPNQPLYGLDPRMLNGIVQCGTGSTPAGCMIGHMFNPAPRIGFAWDPTGDGKTSIRGGYGMFFEHGTADESNTGSLEGGAPLVLDMTQLNPAGYNSIGAAGNGQSLAFPLNVTSIPTKEIWPYVQQWSLSVQRELPRQMLLTVAYVGSKGTNLPVELQINQLKPLPADENPYSPGQPIIVNGFNPNINSLNGDCSGILMNGVAVTGAALTNLQAACYGIGQTTVNPNALRQKYPGFGEIYSLQNIANSSYNSMQVSFRRAVAPLILGVAYTYSHSIDEASDRSDATFVNSYDLKSNRASSNFDQRHMLNVSYVYKMPTLRWLDWVQKEISCKEIDIETNPDCAAERPYVPPTSRANWVYKWIDSWELSGVTTIQSGIPFSVINYGSPNGISTLDNAGVANGAGAGSYPDLCGNPYGDIPQGGNNSSSFGPLLRNPGAFCAPTGLTFGNAGRNALRNPGRWNSDIALLKHFTLNNESTIEFRIEEFNFLNHTQFNIYDPTLGNQPNNTMSCYGGLGTSYSGSGGDGTNCLTGSSFLHPVSAHRPRTMQLGLKWLF